MTLSEKLRGHRFAGFGNYDLGDILYSFSEYLRISPPGRSFRQNVVLLSKIFLESDAYALAENRGEILLAFVSPQANRRGDIRDIRRNILSLGVEMDSLDVCAAVHFAISGVPKTAAILIRWWIQLGRCGVSRRIRPFVIDRMLSLWRFRRFCDKNVDLRRYRLVTVFYDSEPHHHLLVRMAQHLGVKTATLQHGVILAPRDGARDNIDFAGLEFLGSCADIFLAWNEFTVSEGVKAGIPKERFRVVGSCKDIGKPGKTMSEKTARGLFGVLLDGQYTRENNPELIRIASDFAARNGLKFEVRYHPRFRGNEYASLLSTNLSLSPRTGDSIDSYLSRMDFVIAASSTAVMDALSSDIPVYLYSSGAVTEKYRDIPCRKFTTAESLGECFVAEADEAIQKCLRNQLAVEGSVEDCYKRELSNLCGGVSAPHFPRRDGSDNN